MTTLTASQALREGAAKLRKLAAAAKNGTSASASETPVSGGDVTPKRGLQVENVLLPNERVVGIHYDPLPSAFDPPRKKVKQEPV